MRALAYSFRLGWASVLRSGGSGAFAVLAISLAMIVLGALLLVTWNGERMLARWSSAAEFSVYLRDDASSEERGAIEAILNGQCLRPLGTALSIDRAYDLNGDGEADGAGLFFSAYILNTVFALTYNVGDPPVFLLPGHVFTALAAARPARKA